MNELQKVEFDLFTCFAQTCEKLNLKYFLVCGSALGAARHGGFIPWDDDMDVGMYREDYNKFMELAPAILPEGIFLQNYKTDPCYPHIFAKLRNSNTTYIERGSAKLNINHGIYLDIFPLDGYPESPSEQRKISFYKKYYTYKLSCAFTLPATLKGKIVMLAFRLFGCHKRTTKTAAKYESLISKYPVKDAKIICNHGTWYGSKDFIPADSYGKGSQMTFEGYIAWVPENCDKYLTCLYGDWRTPPPPEKQKGHHYYEICDTEKSYIYYINKK